MKNDIELSVILTAHDETLVAGPTLAAADAAIAQAADAGIRVERLVTLDNATAATNAFFHQPALDHWEKRVFSEGDLGRVRNAVVPEAKGRYIAFLDADDIFSTNWLKDGVLRLRAAEDAGERAIAHPELNWLFDGAHSVFYKPDQTDPLFSPWHFYFMNYYDSLCMCPRDAHLSHPYVHRDIPAGLSFQDWQFSIDTMDAGWVHRNVPGTIIFKRRRDSSLVSESRARRAVIRQTEAMAIDRIQDLGRTVALKSGGWSGLKRAIQARTSKPKTKSVPLPDDAPHYGAGIHARVERAKARRGRVPDEYVYDAIEEAFDHLHYLTSNRDIAALEDVDPIAHYIRAGWREGRNPTPWFSTEDYLRKNPNVAKSGTNPFFHWLKSTVVTRTPPRPVVDFDLVAETIGLEPDAAFDLWKARFEDLRDRLASGDLGQQVVNAVPFEPLIEQGWPDALAVKIPPFHTNNVSGRTAAMWGLAKAAEFKRARHVICVNRARFGNAPRIEGHMARALAARDGADQVLVISTDKPGSMPRGKFPIGVRVVDFAEIAGDIAGDPRRRLLLEFIRSLCARHVYNVNSRLMWDMMSDYGTALGKTSSLYACLLCNEKNNLGYWTGYPLRRVYRHFEQLTAIYTDSAFLADDLKTRYMIPPELAGRIGVLPNPVDATIPVVQHNPRGKRPQIFWAGRFDAQKRIDLAFEIARAMPDCDLRMWGESVMGGDAPLPYIPENVNLEGPFKRFDDLPLNRADLWLYTAAWDGVPSMLLEVSMTGIPIVGSDVGGTGEVLRDEMSWKLSPDASVDDWVQAIRDVLNDQEAARIKAAELRDTMMRERTVETHADALFQLLKEDDDDSATA